MDVEKQNLSLYTIVVISVFTLGLCSGQDISLSDIIAGEIQASDPQLRDRRAFYSTFDPEIDWSRKETDNDADNTLVNLLKRNYLDSGSGRFPRINQRKIIPFYQYGNEYRFYQPSPRFSSPRRYSYFVSPWKMSSSNGGSRFARGARYE